ncbi:hypothetical protein [Methylomonas rivi]|uniref:Uncharacterized protein n=1 Tax=Methylomonas rivi TaxID=2952226 RepID=A0ABT1UAH6_9GAMM|nr:hypothetical protein [Methylomonas sp. WSC-6]MCQ8130860.1 hypothetical protein [Methylomonas sp. WSC-6]
MIIANFREMGGKGIRFHFAFSVTARLDYGKSSLANTLTGWFAADMDAVERILIAFRAGMQFEPFSGGRWSVSRQVPTQSMGTISGSVLGSLSLPFHQA